MLLKKNIVGLGSLLISLVLSMPANAQQTKKAAGIKNIVLVHGAFADGSSYAKIIPILQSKGYHVIAVQNPLTSLQEDVAATKRVLAGMEGNVLLVGHSYGGVVITEAGNDAKVAGLFYIAAIIPGDGQSLADVSSAYPPAPGNAEIRKDEAGFLSLTPKGINENFAQDLPAADRKVVYATQVPWAVGATTTKVSTAAWKNKPSWFIVATEDGMVPLAMARDEAKTIRAKAFELKSSHVPMLSQPERVAALIIQAAQQL